MRNIALTPNDLARFWTKVDLSGDCWLWKGCVLKSGGYGSFGIRRDGNSLQLRAHVIAWELTYGPVPDGLVVCHHCDVPACVRPAHLFTGTRGDNIRDCRAKGRWHRPTGTGGVPGERHHNAKLTEALVRQLRTEAAQGFSRATIARRHSLPYYAVVDAVLRRTWRHVP